MIKLREIPKSSGVYMFKVNDVVIYIGSSNNLYQRMAEHNTYISKGSNAKCNPALYQFLQNNQFTVEFQLTDDYREEEQKLIDQYQKQYYKQQCLYNGETMTLNALRQRFMRYGIEHPTIEAKKYLI